MKADGTLRAIVDALGLPSGARVDARVPKKLLVEQGAPMPADKRAIQDGIDELQWFAACKPTTIGVPIFSDDTREYLEIAVVSCAFRPGAKAARLIELIHRGVPYPVFLISTDESGATASMAHKRYAHNETGKIVIERIVEISGLHPESPSPEEESFFASLRLADQPRRDLFALYEGWVTRIEALTAARISGAFAVTDDAAIVVRRRDALGGYVRVTREISRLAVKAKKEKQLSHRVSLNLEIQRLEAELAQHKSYL